MGTLIVLIAILAVVYSMGPKTVKSCEDKKTLALQDQCYIDNATRELDESLCKSVLDQQKKDDCYNVIAQVTKNPSLCEKVSVWDPDRDSCYNVIASYTKDMSLCEKIGKDSVKATCLAGAK